MLDKTKPEAEVAADQLAIGIQFAAQVGNGRQLSLTAGVPLDLESGALNSLLDKLGGAMDRQATKYRLDEMRLTLSNMEKQYATTEQQVTNFKMQAEAEWQSRRPDSGRAWKPTEVQNKQMRSFENTREHLAVQIKKLRVEVEDAEKKCR